MERIKQSPGILILIGLAIRLAIAPWFHGFQYDMYIYGNWAETLVNHPLRDFYAHAESPDHLPGDLYIHWMLGHGFQIFGGENFYGAPYRFILKAFPALIDCILVLLAYCFVRRQSSEKSSVTLVAVLILSPALIFLSAAWGQWDTVSMAIFLGGLLLLWGYRPQPIPAAMLFGWALLIKPPLFLLVLPAVIGYAWKAWQGKESTCKLAANLAGMAVAAAATVTALMYPFGMTWLDSWGDISLQGRLQMAADLYPYTTLGAANIWMIPIGSPDRIVDSQTILLMSLQTIGMLLTVISAGWIAFRAIRSRFTPQILLWAMAMLGYAWFLLPTRSHERYLFPAIVMLAILAATTAWKPTISRYFWISSFAYFFNLVFVYRMPPGAIGVVIFEILSITHVIVFVMLMFIPDEDFAPHEATSSPPVGARTASESRPVG